MLKIRTGNLQYDEVNKAKKITFLKVYDDLVRNNNGIRYLTKPLGDIRKYSIGRGTKLNVDESIDYERFIPKKEYIKEDNRFSPPGVEWLYLALGSRDSVQNVAKREIKILSGERFGFCYFILDKTFDEKKVVDLTVVNKVEFDVINSALEEYGQNYFKQALKTGKINDA